MHAEQTAFNVEEQDLLREALRALLARHWAAGDPGRAAVEPAAIASICERLADFGLPAIGGWTGALVALGELGRAACGAPLLESALWQRLAQCATGLELPPAFAAQLAAGRARFAVAFGAWGGDPDAGSARLSASETVTGELAFIEGAGMATHWLVALGADGLSRELWAVVAHEPSTCSVQALPGLSAAPLERVLINAAPAMIIPGLPAGTTGEVAALARLGLVARSLGAARRAFELVVDHAKTRRQFGQPIGRFQAIQHKLANGMIALDATTLLLEDAAHRIDAGAADWMAAVDATVAFAAPSLRQLELEIHHAFGAIGFAEEHEAPRHFRRVFSDLSRLGGARRARGQLAARLLEGGGAALSELDLGPGANAFRREVRAWLAEHWNTAARARERARPFQERGVDYEFSSALGRKGWIAVSWPREYGGLGLGPLEQFAFIEEMALAGAPLGAHSCASEMIGPALIAFGTEEQKCRFLPAFLRGELTFSLGYSESGAGSDLASLRMSAVRDGDGWILEGEKLWTSRGDIAHYHWLAARTNPDASPPHAGISVFMVPLDSPGITLRSELAMYGHTFSSVRYDKVRIPDTARVGEVDGGWKVITHALANERILMGSYVGAIRALFEALVRHAASAEHGGSPLRDDPLLRDRLGALAAEIEAARQLAVNGVRIVARGGLPIHEAAMSKVYSGELLQRLAQAAIDLLGPVATLGEDAGLAILDGRIEQQLRRSIMMVVGGGTAEVQRNLIATRGLGLPR